MKARSLSTVLALAFLAVLPSRLFAQSDASDAWQNLKGIKVFTIVVGETTKTLQENGVTKASVTLDSELRMRKAGINIVSFNDVPNGTSIPALLIDVGGASSTNVSGIVRFTMKLQFSEVVTLSPIPPGRPDAIRTYATTWHIDNSGMIASSRVKAEIKDLLADLLDEFINAYLKANPKAP